MSSKHTSIVSRLEHLAHSKPDKPAFIFVDQLMNRRVLSRLQIWNYCRKYVTVLKRRGLGNRNVICNTLPNSPHRIIIDWGIITSGAITMDGQMATADGSDLVKALITAKASAIILDPDDTTKGIFSMLKPKLDTFDPESGQVSCPDIPSLKYILTYSLKTENGNTSLMDYLDAEDEMTHEDLKPDDVCQYLCTSGSTSTYKLVAFTSEILLEFGVKYGGVMGAKEDDVYMNTRPLGWLGGHPAIHLAFGTSRVLFDESNGVPEKFSECQWDILCQERCDLLHTNPHSLTDFSLIRKQRQDPEIENFRLRNIFSSGGPTSCAQIRRALDSLTEGVSVGYGSTEAGIGTFYTITQMDQFEDFVVGWPRPDAKVRIVDRYGQDVPPGQMGEILLQTSNRALYYVGESEKTSKTFLPGGYVRMDDIGMINSKGQLALIGRTKFAIRRDTAVIYPRIVETVVQACPGVKEVVVTGVPDEERRQEICVVIIKEPGVCLSSEDVLYFCNPKLADHELLSTSNFVLFVDSYPLTSNGKVDRNGIQQLASQRLGLLPTMA